MMRALLIVVLLASLAGFTSQAQDCPRNDPNGPFVDSIPRTLHGRVVFHNDLRQWLSLELDKPVCGERTVQILMLDKNSDSTGHLETFRGCRVKATGPLGLAGTLYYSADIYQTLEKIEPDPDCVRQTALPDYSKSRPARGIRSYQVKLWFDFYGPQGPLHGRVTSGAKVLTPWQAYATYSFNGAEDLVAGCTGGYSMKRWWATPGAKPWAMDAQVYLSPEWAAEKHIRHIQLSYSCNL